MRFQLSSMRNDVSLKSSREGVVEDTEGEKRKYRIVKAVDIVVVVVVVESVMF